MRKRTSDRPVEVQWSILENATALGSRIPPHGVLLQVNDNTLVKLYSLFKNGVHLRNDVRTIIYIQVQKKHLKMNKEIVMILPQKELIQVE